MRKLYWRPHRISRTVLLLIAFYSLAGMIAVEHFQIRREQPYYREKLAAAKLAREALEVIKAERLQRGLAIEPDSDPLRSGLIGSLMTPITSNTGVLSAKRTSINPNFAAVVVQMIRKAGVESGDTVAVGLSGSFPALNIAVYSALETLKIKPIVISSVAASQWGANLPQFLWIDMEKELFKARIFSFRSVAASLGGIEDRGLGMSKEGKKLIYDGIERNQIPLIKEKTFAQSLEQHMSIYREQANLAPIKLFINVGGGSTSVGARIGKKVFRPGLNLREPPGAEMIDSAMTRFMIQGVPIVHLTQVERLAKRYGLPLQPSVVPKVGEGKIFYQEEYNLWLTLSILFSIFLILYAFIRSEWGVQVLRSGERPKGKGTLEPTI